MVVSAEGKGPARTGSGVWQEEDRKGTTMEVSKRSDDVKTAADRYCGTSSGEACLRTEAASGIKVA